MYAKLEIDSSRVSRVREDDIASEAAKLGWSVSPTGRTCFIGYVYPDTRDVRKALKLLAYNKIDVFFDGIGRAWHICSANEQGARKFGPLEYARPLSEQELRWYELYSERKTPLEMAQGRIVPFRAWNCLIE